MADDHAVPVTRTWTVPSSSDEELDAIAVCHAALRGLPPDVAGRVSRYIAERYQTDEGTDG